MIQSMTAFARMQKELDAANLCWEIRSVNHRYLDVSFRLPEPFRFLETQLRNTLRDKISRGKLECQLKYQERGSSAQSMVINEHMVKSLLDLSHHLAVSHHLANDLGISQVLAWPGVVGTCTTDIDELGQQVLALFVAAIEQLCEARLAEGKALKSHIEGRLHELSVEVKRSLELAALQMEHVKDKLLTRLDALRMDVPEARVEQEMALIISRLDVSEELDRLHTHIDEVSRTLNCDKIAGRRLDFLMQELNREANTLSSKSDSVELTQRAVEMKVLIEQMREQIQNIE